MFRTTSLHGYLIELAVVFVGVALAFAVENLREDLSERREEAQYLSGFRQDLLADSAMLSAQYEDRQAQLAKALILLEFFDGRAIDPDIFFEAYYGLLAARKTTPNRNTMAEVLNSGSLRLIRSASTRSGLLNLYAMYDRIAGTEAHMTRDFEEYLYDPTFSSIPIQIEGPWGNTAASRRAVELLLDNVTIENGIRLVVANLGMSEGGLLEELESAQSRVQELLRIIPAN